MWNGGGGGFFIACEDFGRMFDHSFSACVFLFFFFVFFFFKVEISSRKLISLFVPGSVHSGSASRDDCGRMFAYKLRVSSFPERFPHFAWTPGSRDSLLVTAPDSWSKRCEFESRRSGGRIFFSRVNFVCWLLCERSKTNPIFVS